jgi:hypothetical protein
MPLDKHSCSRSRRRCSRGSSRRLFAYPLLSGQKYDKSDQQNDREEQIDQEQVFRPLCKASVRLFFRVAANQDGADKSDKGKDKDSDDKGINAQIGTLLSVFAMRQR